MVDSKFQVEGNVIRHCKQIDTTDYKKKYIYKFAIYVEVKVACVIHKLFHVLNMLTCNELFAIGTSTMGLVTCEVVRVVNIMFKSLITWAMDQRWKM